MDIGLDWRIKLGAVQACPTRSKHEKEFRFLREDMSVMLQMYSTMPETEDRSVTPAGGQQKGK